MTKLTDRQYEIAKLAATGLSNKGIANKLGITEGTVKVHLHQIFTNLGIGSRVMLAVKWRTEIRGDAAAPH